MKKSLITLAVAAVAMAPMAVNAAADKHKSKAKFFGYAQITAAAGKGDYNNKDADGLRFGADSVRLGYKVKYDKVWGMLQFDVNKTDKADNIGIPEIIKDAVVGYKFKKAANVSAGVFKTPVGMDFSNPSKYLDITKRGMETGLVLERAAGLMVSGRDISGFGYDLGMFNPTQRSAAVDFGTAGDGSGYAGRVIYDMGETLHLEASYGTSTQDSSATAEDYTVWGAGGTFNTGAMTFKAEYVAGSDVKGKKDYEESVWYLHGGYAINKKNELVIRHYAANSKKGDGSETDLGNTYFGWNIFLGEHALNGRIQLNYVLVSGDNDTFSGAATKKYAYTDDIFLAQFQVGF